MISRQRTATSVPTATSSAPLSASPVVLALLNGVGGGVHHLIRAGANGTEIPLHDVRQKVGRASGSLSSVSMRASGKRRLREAASCPVPEQSTSARRTGTRGRGLYPGSASSMKASFPSRSHAAMSTGCVKTRELFLRVAVLVRGEPVTDLHLPETVIRARRDDADQDGRVLVLFPDDEPSDVVVETDAGGRVKPEVALARSFSAVILLRLCGEETFGDPGETGETGDLGDPGVAGGFGESVGAASTGYRLPRSRERRDTVDVGDATAEQTAAGTGEDMREYLSHAFLSHALSIMHARTRVLGFFIYSFKG